MTTRRSVRCEPAPTPLTHLCPQDFPSPHNIQNLAEPIQPLMWTWWLLVPCAPGLMPRCTLKVARVSDALTRSSRSAGAPKTRSASGPSRLRPTAARRRQRVSRRGCAHPPRALAPTGRPPACCRPRASRSTRACLPSSGVTSAVLVQRHAAAGRWGGGGGGGWAAGETAERRAEQVEARARARR